MVGLSYLYFLLFFQSNKTFVAYDLSTVWASPVPDVHAENFTYVYVNYSSKAKFGNFSSLSQLCERTWVYVIKVLQLFLSI